jgi:hypothetical protein
MVPSWQHYGTYDESAHPDLWNGVVGYWAPCLGPTGLRLHDVSRWNNWGNLTNMEQDTDWIVSNGRYALDFGGGEYTTGATAPLTGTVNFTLSTWVYIYSTGQTAPDGVFPILGQKPPTLAGAGVLIYYWYSGALAQKLTISTGNGSTGSQVDTSSATAIQNQWAHIAFVRRNGATNNGFFVVNGIEFPLASSLTILDVTTTSPFRIATDGNAFRAGRFICSDATVWNRGMSIDEIRELYRIGAGGMLQRRSRRRGYVQQAGFRAYYATQRNAQLIGGGLK